MRCNSFDFFFVLFVFLNVSQISGKLTDELWDFVVTIKSFPPMICGIVLVTSRFQKISTTETNPIMIIWFSSRLLCQLKTSKLMLASINIIKTGWVSFHFAEQKWNPIFVFLHAKTKLNLPNSRKKIIFTVGSMVFAHFIHQHRFYTL